MVDVHTKKQRSFNMSKVKGVDTKPELVIRKALFAKGFRYRLHVKDLPGKPDLVLPKYKAVIFINGCFWHYHDCSLFKMPETRKDWWKQKLVRNRERDFKNIEQLMENGWRVLIVWECSFRKTKKIDYNKIADIEGKIIDWVKNDKKNFKEIRGQNEPGNT
ncbi:DNA mismatch endonuclease Vsr [Candidatus Pacearchaeota archaeon]|nr:DNA mismatch endonuclease Vsr [Candidatus Pacearchaeota archaeon]